eukprot:scaffold478518_cov19-Prasinocladus_malaysianus.AAC.1
MLGWSHESHRFHGWQRRSEERSLFDSHFRHCAPVVPCRVRNLFAVLVIELTCPWTPVLVRARVRVPVLLESAQRRSTVC